jgi:cytoskeletal protein RodZ
MENHFNDKTERSIKSHDEVDNPTKRADRKKLLITILVALVLLATLWLWKNIQINNERKEAERKNEMLQERASGLITNAHKEHLKLLAKPYVWAVRTELLKGNINQVNLYANEMVKEKNFQNIVVANDKGVIISSTNKKNEGQPFTSVGKPNYLTSDTTTVENINDSILVMSSPVMGFNNRLGTMMITYKVKRPEF